MLEVEVPTITATLSGPYRSRAASTLEMNPSAVSPRQASRLFLQSHFAKRFGSGSDSSPATRPIQVASGVAPKSLSVRPERRSWRCASVCSRPCPADEDRVYAVILSGFTGVPVLWRPARPRSNRQPDRAVRLKSLHLLHSILLDVGCEGAQRAEDAYVVLVVRTHLKTIALRYLERQFQRIDRIEPKTGFEKRRFRVDVLRLHSFEIQSGDDEFRELMLAGRLQSCHET